MIPCVKKISIIILDELRMMRVIIDKRRLEATAIVMLGVIGAEFGADLESFDAKTSSSYKRGGRSNSRTLVWHTSMCITLMRVHLIIVTQEWFIVLKFRINVVITEYPKSYWLS